MTCADCTSWYLRFIPHSPEHQPFCDLWQQIIDPDNHEACDYHNPDSLPPTVRATVETARGLASGAEPLPPM